MGFYCLPVARSGSKRMRGGNFLQGGLPLPSYTSKDFIVCNSEKSNTSTGFDCADFFFLGGV